MTDRRRVLVVEDDPRLGSMLQEYLQTQGFYVDVEVRGDHAVARITASPPDLVVLDLMLPGLDGIEVCQRVRNTFAGPILMLTARRGDIDQVAGLEAGADDYVIKPCKPRVLLARVRALLRRTQSVSEPEDTTSRLLFRGSLSIDQESREVRIAEEPVVVTSTEFDLLWFLAVNRGRVVSRDDLYIAVRGGPWDGIDRGMDVHVSRIRAKLKSSGLHSQAVKAVRGRGYQFTLKPL